MKCRQGECLASGLVAVQVLESTITAAAQRLQVLRRLIDGIALVDMMTSLATAVRAFAPSVLM